MNIAYTRKIKKEGYFPFSFSIGVKLSASGSRINVGSI